MYSNNPEDMKNNPLFNKKYYYETFDKVFAIRTTNKNCISYLNNIVYKADGFIFAFSKNKDDKGNGGKWNIFPTCISQKLQIDYKNIDNAKKLYKLKRYHLDICKKWELLTKGHIPSHLNKNCNEFDFYYTNKYGKIQRI